MLSVARPSVTAPYQTVLQTDIFVHDIHATHVLASVHSIIIMASGQVPAPSLG